MCRSTHFGRFYNRRPRTVKYHLTALRPMESGLCTTRRAGSDRSFFSPCKHQYHENTPPKNEYPRPNRSAPLAQLKWSMGLATDPDNLGIRQQWWLREKWPETITVPFCPNSPASSPMIPITTVWYHRTFELPDWASADVVLNIGLRLPQSDLHKFPTSR